MGVKKIKLRPGRNEKVLVLKGGEETIGKQLDQLRTGKKKKKKNKHKKKKEMAQSVLKKKNLKGRKGREKPGKHFPAEERGVVERFSSSNQKSFTTSSGVGQKTCWTLHIRAW